MEGSFIILDTTGSSTDSVICLDDSPAVNCRMPKKNLTEELRNEAEQNLIIISTDESDANNTIPELECSDDGNGHTNVKEKPGDSQSGGTNRDMRKLHCRSKGGKQAIPGYL